MDQEGGHCILYSEDDLYDVPDTHDSNLENEKGTITSQLEHTGDDSQPMTKAFITTAENTSKVMKVVDADDVCFFLTATSFEESLVRSHFTQWIALFVGYNRNANGTLREIPNPLKEHLIRVFTEQGRHED
jgi:hypothetical protein